MSLMTFKEAKTKADKIGGVVFWWFSYYVLSTKEVNEASGTPHYVSKKAEKFFRERYRKYKQEMAQRVKDVLTSLKH